jgi:hypothetical protein
MKNLSIILFGMLLLLSASAIAVDDASGANTIDTTKAAEVAVDDATGSDQIVVYYLHMNRRCMTCEKLEAYSQEAVTSGFADQLADSSVVWRVANFETEGNEHFAKDYQLYSQSLILSRQHNGDETEWKNLDEIWKLVGDKEKFIAYVQTEVSEFMNGSDEK